MNGACRTDKSCFHTLRASYSAIVPPCDFYKMLDGRNALAPRQCSRSLLSLRHYAVPKQTCNELSKRSPSLFCASGQQVVLVLPRVQKCGVPWAVGPPVLRAVGPLLRPYATTSLTVFCAAKGWVGGRKGNGLAAAWAIVFPRRT